MSLRRGMERKLVNSLDRHGLLSVVTCSGHREALWVKESMDFLFYILSLLSKRKVALSNIRRASSSSWKADVCPAQSTDVSD